jgi:hypothetical protein
MKTIMLLESKSKRNFLFTILLFALFSMQGFANPYQSDPG